MTSERALRDSAAGPVSDRLGNIMGADVRRAGAPTSLNLAAQPLRCVVFFSEVP